MLEAFTLNVTVLPGVANDWFGVSISYCGEGVACTGSVECIPARPRPITATKRIPNVRNAGIVSPNVTYGRKCLASKKVIPGVNSPINTDIDAVAADQSEQIAN